MITWDNSILIGIPTVGIGNTIKKKLELEKTENNIAKGLFSIFVEQVQNVIRCSTDGATR